MNEHIISVHNNWKDNVLGIHIGLGNVCNYKCWYCWPGSNAGNLKFPNFEIFKNNLDHLLTWYRDHTNKTVFALHFSGGEPTYWKDFLKLIKHLKKNFNCLISVNSNGSQKIEWWKTAAPHFDRAVISCHHEYIDVEHTKTVCDILYKSGALVDAFVMMDSNNWEKCENIAKQLATSKYKWTIKFMEIVDQAISYTPEQKEKLNKFRVRRTSIFHFLKNNKYYVSKVKITTEDGKVHRVKDNFILLNKLNNFKGWECSLGVDWIDISLNGDIKGNCGNKIYNSEVVYNINDLNFEKNFNPHIEPTICRMERCCCQILTIMPKRKINNSDNINRT